MTESDDEIRLITRHLCGETTPQEEADLARWLEADPGRDRLLAALREGWAATGATASSTHDVERGWSRVLAGMGTDRALPRPAGRAAQPRTFAPPVDRTGWRRAARVAAALALILLPAALLWRALGGSGADNAALEVQVPRGQMTTLKLPDGSRVVVAAGSTLRYPHRFGARDRELRLEGMAYFDVADDPDRPFRVAAGGSTTRVMGTRFVVRAYPDDAGVEVAVEEGRVELGAEGAPRRAAVALRAGQMGRLQGGRLSVAPAGDLAAQLGWVEGRPAIRDLPLPEAFRELERWYDVHLRIEDPALAGRRITTTAERSSLRETLELIALALNARYVQRGDTLVFLSGR